MTEFEFIEISTMAIELVSDSAMDFVTVTFAYVAAAYITGKKLSRTAAVLVSGVYSLALIGPVLGMNFGITMHVQNVAEYKLAFPEGQRFRESVDLGINYSITLGPLVLGWLGSLIYMHRYIRKTPKTSIE